MTVGATKIRIQQEAALASLLKGDVAEASDQSENATTEPEEACAT